MNGSKAVKICGYANLKFSVYDSSAMALSTQSLLQFSFIRQISTRTSAAIILSCSKHRHQKDSVKDLAKLSALYTYESYPWLYSLGVYSSS